MASFQAKKVMFDSNVILDYLLKRGTAEHQANLEKIFKSSIYGICEGCIMASSITDLFYIMESAGNLDAKSEIRKIIQLYTIISVTEKECLQATHSAVADFEDALLVECAKQNKIERLVTSNEKDFAKSGLILYTVSAFATELTQY